MGLKTSSQFVSALMMAAPALPGGLHIHLEKGGGSFPYLELTAGVMQECGLEVQFSRDEIVIPAQPFKEKVLRIEDDWSSAAAFYGILALMPAGSSFVFPGLHLGSLQGDRVLARIPVFRHILTEKYENGLRITRVPGEVMPAEVFWDFSDCPDLALAVIATCAAAGIAGEFVGLSSLQLKESRRLEALASELRKVGVILNINSDSSGASLNPDPMVWQESPPEFDCHGDHRIAMALSILLFSAPGRKAVFRQPDVVEKSFPHFWEEVCKAGGEMEEI
jgi:3-phosphoshikimate 1-carboxyvinyltransferase